MYLSLIIPIYNEEENLENNIFQILSYLKTRKFPFEIILVNDGSTDDTLKIAKRLSKKHQSIKLISYKQNKGKGHAIRQGLLAGKGEYLGFVDADNASPIKNIQRSLISLQNAYDVVIGSRNEADVFGARQIKPQNRIKRVLGTGGNKLIKIIIRQNINDTQCGFKMFTRRFVDSVIPKTKINRWAIDVEILLLAKRHNYKIDIIPIEWTCGPVSRVGVLGYFITLKELLEIWLRDTRGIYKNTRNKL